LIGLKEEVFQIECDEESYLQSQRSFRNFDLDKRRRKRDWTLKGELRMINFVEKEILAVSAAVARTGSVPVLFLVNCLCLCLQCREADVVSF
jgi:hypothetical protein